MDRESRAMTVHAAYAHVADTRQAKHLAKVNKESAWFISKHILKSRLSIMN